MTTVVIPKMNIRKFIQRCPLTIKTIFLNGQNKFNRTYTNISFDEGFELCEFLKTCKNITNFAMKNYIINQRTCHHIINTLRWHPLTNLNMSSNRINDIRDNIFTYIGDVDIASSVLGSTIRVLDLSNACFAIEHVDNYLDASNFIQFLRKTKTLTHLTMTNCHYSNLETYDQIHTLGIANNRSIKCFTFGTSIAHSDTLMEFIIACNRTIQYVECEQFDNDHHARIHSKREAIRQLMIDKISMLLATFALPAEMFAIIVNYIGGVPVKYIGGMNKKIPDVINVPTINAYLIS